MKAQRFELKKASFFVGVILFCLSLIGAENAFAQNSQTTDYKADQNLKSNARVNPITHAMEFSLPFGGYPGRGGNSLPIGLSYSSKVWNMKKINSRFDSVPSTNPDYDFEEYQSFDIGPFFGERTNSGWTSTLQPVMLLEDTEIYNQSGESMDLIGPQSLVNQEQISGWTCELGVHLEFNSNCMGLAWVVYNYCHTDSECTSYQTGEYECATDWGGNPTGGPINPPPGGNGPPGGPPAPGPTPAPEIPHQVKRVRVQTSDGTTHEFRKDDKLIECTEPGVCYGTDAGTYLSVDSSGLRLQRGEVQNPQTGETRDVLYLPDGGKYIFADADTQSGPLYKKAEKFVDKNGNFSTYDIGSHTWTDTMRREIQDPLKDPLFPFHVVNTPEYYYLKDIGGGDTRLYSLKWQKLENVFEDPAHSHTKILGEDTCNSVLPQPVEGEHLFSNHEQETDFITGGVKYIRRQRACASPSGGGLTTVFNPVVLSEVILPNGKEYQFKYNEYGEITRIDYPTGGYERFVYGHFEPIGVTALEVYTQANRGVTERYISFDGTTESQVWTYGQNANVMSVTAPDGTKTESYVFTSFASGFGFEDPRDGMVYETRVKDSNGVLRSRTLTNWDYLGPQGTGAYTYAKRDPRIKRSVNFLFDPNSGSALATLTEMEYDTGAGPDPTYFSHLNLKRKTAYQYAVINNKTTVDDEELGWTTIESWFPDSKKASITETDYMYDPIYGQGYRARGIIGLPIETRVMDPANGTTILSKANFFYDNWMYSEIGTPSQWVAPTGENPDWRGNLTLTRTWLKDPVTQTENEIETSAQYDKYGNLRLSFDAAGNQTETQYSEEYSYAYPTKIIAPAPDPTNVHGTNQTSSVESTYDPATGLPLSVKDDYGQITKTEYDTLLRPTRAYAFNFSAPESQTIYDDTNNKTTVRKQIDELNWDEATTFIDKLGRTVKTQAKDSQGDVFVETHYDAMGRVDRVTNPYRSGDTVYWNKTRFDEMGRAVESYAPATLANLGSAQSLGTTSFDFSTVSGSVGTVVISNDASGRKGRSITNALSQLVRVDEPTAFGGSVTDDLGAIGTPNQPTYYTYSPLGKMVKVAQGAQSRYFLYDNLGRLLRVKQPEQEANAGLPAYTDPLTSNSNWSAGFTYDALGNILTATDAKGTVIHNSYDNAGRVKTRSYTNEPSGITTPQVDYYYDGLGVSGANFAKGKLTKVSSSVSENRYTNFDNMGRVLSSEQATDGQTYPMSYKYNLSGALTEETYPSGEVVRNFLKSDGDISRVAVSGHTCVSDFSYTAGGGISTLKLGNGTWETAQFNSRQQVTQHGLGTANNNTSLWKVDYEYGELSNGTVDPAKNTGNIAKQTLTIPSTSFVQTYTYDSLYRLTEAKEKTNTSQNWIQTFGYDRFGNRTSFNQQMGSLTINTTPAVDANTNRFSSGFVYDKNGNITQDGQSTGTRAFVFNGDNKQTQVKDNNGVSVGTYSYDGEGKRVKKVVTNSETTVFVYDGIGRLVAEYSNQISSSPTISYTTTDHLGSPRIVTDKSGNVISRRDFMPFGEDLNAGTPNRAQADKYALTGDTLRKKFTGYEKDTEIGLDFAEARYYNNQHGRFTAVDPLLTSGKSANPQTFNRYVYVGNNPLVVTDPSGLCPGGCQNYSGNTYVYTGKTSTQYYTQAQYDAGDCPEGCLQITGGSTTFTGADGYIYRVAANGWTNEGFNYYGAQAGASGAMYTSVKGMGDAAWDNLAFLTNVSNGIFARATFEYAMSNGQSVRDMSYMPYATPGNQNEANAERSTNYALMIISVYQAPKFMAYEGFQAFTPARNATTAENMFPVIKEGSSGGPFAYKRFSASTREQALAENPNKICVFCRQENASQLDHAFARSKGGNATIDNAQWTCSFCNQSKGAGEFPKNPAPGYRGAFPPPWWKR